MKLISEAVADNAGIGRRPGLAAMPLDSMRPNISSGEKSLVGKCISQPCMSKRKA